MQYLQRTPALTLMKWHFIWYIYLAEFRLRRPTVKTIHVVAAIIEQDRRVLATQRGYGEFEGGWEFPGGKLNQERQKKKRLFAKFTKSSMHKLP